jgi:hypothetical protein
MRPGLLGGVLALSFVAVLTFANASELSSIIYTQPPKELQTFSDDSKVNKVEDHFPIIEDSYSIKLIVPEYVKLPDRKIFVIRKEELSNYRVLRREERTIKITDSIKGRLEQKQKLYAQVLKELLTETYDDGNEKIKPDSFYVDFLEMRKNSEKPEEKATTTPENLMDVKIYKCKKLK